MKKIIKKLSYTSLLICLMGHPTLNATDGEFNLEQELNSLEDERNTANHSLQVYRNRLDRFDYDGSIMRNTQSQLLAAKRGAVEAIRNAIQIRSLALMTIHDSRESKAEKMNMFMVTESQILALAAKIAQLKTDADQAQELRQLTDELQRDYDRLLQETGLVKKFLQRSIGDNPDN
jgi:hypothetical protein